MKQKHDPNEILRLIITGNPLVYRRQTRGSSPRHIHPWSPDPLDQLCLLAQGLGKRQKDDKPKRRRR